jgi:hypothetical protein
MGDTLSDDEERMVNGTPVFKQENRHGVLKDHVRVATGTQVLTVRRHLRNPMTDRREDLTRLSDDGYLKPFLAVYHAADSPDVIDLGSAPILTLDTDRWEYREDCGEFHALVKRDPESTFGDLLNAPEADNA